MHTHPEGSLEQVSSDPPSLQPWPQDGSQKSWQKDNDHGTAPLNEHLIILRSYCDGTVAGVPSTHSTNPLTKIKKD